MPARSNPQFWMGFRMFLHLRKKKMKFDVLCVLSMKPDCCFTGIGCGVVVAHSGKLGKLSEH